MEKRKIRVTSLKLSLDILDNIAVEIEQKKITRTKFIHDLLQSYFENVEKKELPSVEIDNEKMKISIKLLEEYARLLHNETFLLNINKNIFIEALAIEYFTKKNKKV